MTGWTPATAGSKMTYIHRAKQRAGGYGPHPG